METLSKILIIVCVLFLVVGIITGKEEVTADAVIVTTDGTQIGHR